MIMTSLCARFVQCSSSYQDKVSARSITGFSFVILSLASVSTWMASHSSPLLGTSLTTQTVQDDSVVTPELVIQSGHTSTINAVKFNKKGNLLLTASDDGTIKLWDVRSGMILRTFVGHKGLVSSVVFAADDSRVLSESDASIKYADGTIKLWDVVTGKLIKEFGECIEEVDCKMDRRPYFFGDDFYLSPTRDSDELESPDDAPHQVELHSMLTGDLVETFPGSSFGALRPALSSDGKKVWTFASCHDGVCYTRWDVITKKVEIEVAFQDNFGTVAPDGYSAVVKHNNNLELIDLRTGKTIKSFPLKAKQSKEVLYSADGQHVSIELNNEIKILDARTGEGLQSFKQPRDPSRRIFFDAAYGRIAINGSTFELWDLQKREVIFSRSANSPHASINFNPDLVHFSPSGNTIAVWGMEAIKSKRGVKHKPRLECWDPQTGRTLWRKEVSLSQTMGLSLQEPIDHTSDGHLIAFGGTDGSLQLLRSASGEVFWGSDGSAADLVPQLEGEELDFSPFFTQRSAEFGLRRGTNMKLWDSMSGDLIDNIALDRRTVRGRERSSGKPTAVMLDAPTLLSEANGLASPDGRFVVTTSGGSTTGGIHIYGPGLGEGKDMMSGIPAPMVAFSPDSKWLAYQKELGVIGLIDLRKPDNPEINLEGHSSGSLILGVAFTDDAKIMASSATDSAVKLWSIPEGRLLATLVSSAGDWLVVSENGLFDGSPNGMRLIAWRLGTGNDVIPLESFYNHFFHPGLLAEILSGKVPEAKFDLAARLRFPSLRIMAQQGLAHIKEIDGKTYLCLAQEAAGSVADNLKVMGRGDIDLTKDFTTNIEDPRCTYRRELPANQGPYELVGVSDGWKPEAHRLSTSRSHTQTATLHVLTVGIDEYQQNNVYPRLNFSVADADAIRDFFRAQKANAKKPFGRIRVWKGLRNEQATITDILARLAQMAKQVNEDDVVLLFFSGHGRVPPGQSMFYFIPFFPPQSHFTTVDEREVGLSTAMLAEVLRKMSARRVVLIVDACQSGGAIESLAKIGEVKVEIEKRRAALVKFKTRNRANSEVGFYLLAAATPVQEAIEPLPETVPKHLRHGLLTTAILETLQANAASTNDVLSVRQLLDRVSQRLPELAKQRQSIQTPFPFALGVDFPIAAKR